MDIIERLEWRYATKKFDANKMLSDNKLRILKKAFNLTATSFGLQTIKLVIVKDKTIRELLVEHSFYQRQVVDASHLFVLCIQEDILEKDVEQHFENIKTIRDTPETILKPFRADLKQMMADKSLSERHEWSVNQAYIALGNLMTVCAVEGIDACPMEGFLPKKIDELLNLDKHQLKSVLMLPVGHRADDDMFADFKKVRRPVAHSIVEL